MDIEGNELHALKGMKETILKSPELIMFVEFNPSYLSKAGVNPEDILAELDQLGFEVLLIDDHLNQLRPLTENDLYQRDPSWYANLYCARGAVRGLK